MSPAPPDTAQRQATPEAALHAFLELIREKRRLNHRLEEIQEEINSLEPLLLSHFGQNAITQMKLEGMTLSPQRMPWVYPQDGVSRQTVCAVLKASNLASFVTENYSTQTLTAYIKELEEHHQLLRLDNEQAVLDLLPQALAEIIEIRPSYRLHVASSRKRKGE